MTRCFCGETSESSFVQIIFATVHISKGAKGLVTYYISVAFLWTGNILWTGTILYSFRLQRPLLHPPVDFSSFYSNNNKQSHLWDNTKRPYYTIEAVYLNRT